MEFVVAVLIYAVLLLLVAKIVPGIEMDGVGPAFMAGLVMGVLNVILKPILVFFSLPLLLLTLGLFIFILNALLLKLAAAIVPGFTVRSFGSAFIGAVLLGVFSFGMSIFF